MQYKTSAGLRYFRCLSYRYSEPPSTIFKMKKKLNKMLMFYKTNNK